MKEDNKLMYQDNCDTSKQIKNDHARVPEVKQNDNVQNNKKYRISSEYILREIAGEYTIIPVDADGPMDNAIMAPNETAVFIWKCFEEASTLEEVVARGMLEYDVEEEKLRNSVEKFVTESLKYSILEEVE